MTAQGDGEDDVAYIERLLDTLQCENNGEIEELSSAAAAAFDSLEISNEPSLDMRVIDDAEELLASRPTPLGSAKHQDVGSDMDANRWGKLLTRFCEDGDEAVLDTLLDSFLTSKSDPAVLVEAFGQGLTSQAQASTVPRGPYNRPMPLNLDRLDKLLHEDVHSPTQLTMDSLLDSARDLLQLSRRSRSSSTQSPTYMESKLVEAASSAEYQRFGGEFYKDGGAVASLLQVPSPGGNLDALPAELRSPTARAEFLAKVAEMGEEDHEVARTFMKRFFIGVRQRLASDLATASEQDEDEDVDEEDNIVEQSVESGMISNPSAWDCQSVQTMSIDS